LSDPVTLAHWASDVQAVPLAHFFPSSHFSAPKRMPSPHVVVQMLGAVPVQFQLGSFVQLLEQPSVSKGLLSSHCSV